MSKNFETKRNEFLQKFQEAMDAYDELIKEVSPKNWRTTGNHFTEMKKIKKETVDLKEITTVERNMHDLYTEKYY